MILVMLVWIMMEMRVNLTWGLSSNYIFIHFILL